MYDGLLDQETGGDFDEKLMFRTFKLIELN